MTGHVLMRLKVHTPPQQKTEAQRQCTHDMQPTIFTCRVPVPHQDMYCTKCRWHECSYAEVIKAA